MLWVEVSYTIAFSKPQTSFSDYACQASPAKLPTGDSGRFQASNFRVLRADHGFATSSSPSSATHRRTATVPSSEFNRHAVM
ncbi:hypothetical protein E3N88_23976 [Mikania micrantha]|uniref:Uncharacterized protein n=1 Tax=Mikania micrantha TaxID=192012 RepID=A0A5N6NHB3_9ASTR|nr:hypothetical protein E3N88_42249 [Mikania micrantha]KAD4586375.1 hypothetical protein E3N88_23976 [Mikania micrantha]